MEEKTMFVAFDGGDGAGKSSQLNFLIEFLKENNIDHYIFDMGGFEYTKKYLYALKNHKLNCSTELRELLYYYEGRLFTDYYRKLKKDTVVICDRWFLTYVAYGQLNGIELDELKFFLQNLEVPDLYFYLDISPEISLNRIKQNREGFSAPEIGLKNKMSDDECENDRNFIKTQTKIREYYKIAINNINCKITEINADQDIQKIKDIIIESFIIKYKELKNNGFRCGGKQQIF